MSPRKSNAPVKEIRRYPGSSIVDKRTDAERRDAARKLSGSKPLKRSTKPIPKRNAERQARKAIGYRAGMAAYRKSETFKQVELRAGGQCEKWVTVESHYAMRCPNRRGDEGVKLHHHHATYARFGGNELQADMLVCCTPHHDEIEAQLRPWNRNRVLG